ncbi:MAG: hypothetical protein R3F11_21655 [Verrucomicrobiales bacterium]
MTAAAQPVSAPPDGRAPDFIKVMDFSFYYGESQALHHIDMDIPEREVTA